MFLLAAAALALAPVHSGTAHVDNGRDAHTVMASEQPKIKDIPLCC